jgi:hypothetical protein
MGFCLKFLFQPNWTKKRTIISNMKLDVMQPIAQIPRAPPPPMLAGEWYINPADDDNSDLVPSFIDVPYQKKGPDSLNIQQFLPS